MEYAAGIDLGGSSVKAIAVTPEGRLLQDTNVPFDPGVHMDWGEKIRGIIAEFTSTHDGAPSHIGLSAPGLAATDHSTIVNMPGRLEGLVGLDWQDYLQHTKRVPVLNDAHSALLGEAWLGAGKGQKHLVMLTLGTGVGGAALVDGKLLMGRSGRAGHFGHASLDPDGEPDICGCPGSLEVQMGTCTVNKRSGGRFKNTKELVDAAQSGDEEAMKVWMKSLRALAAGITSFINITDPDAVIIGGGVARAGDALFQPVRKLVDEMEWRPTGYATKIVPAEMGEFAGAYGAAKLALDLG